MKSDSREPGPGRRELALACALLALFFALPLARGLFDGDRVLFAVDTATVQAPWSVDGAGGGRARQPGQADQGTFFYPCLRYTIDRWRGTGDRWRGTGRGTGRSAGGAAVPLWNPLLFGGVPHLANPQTGALDPQVLALVALEGFGGSELVDRGLAWLAWMRLVAAAVGAFVLARRLGRSAGEAALVAVGFAGGGHTVLWLNHSLGHVVPFVPWVLVAVDAADGARPARSTLGVAALFLGAILGGHPETAFALGLVGGGWALALGAGPRRRAALGGLALGTLAASVLLVPFARYLLESAALEARASRPRSLDLIGLGALLVVLALVRGAARDGRPLAVVAGAGALLALAWTTLPASAWLALDPLAFGDPARGGYRGPGHALETGSSWLALPLVVSFVAGWFARNPEAPARERLVGGVATFAFLLALGLEPLVVALERVPVLGWVAPARWAAISALFVPLAATASLHRAPTVARRVVLALVLAAGVLPFVRSGAALPEPAEPLATDLVRIDARPERVLSAGALELSGFVAPELAIDAASLRLESLARASEPLEFGLDLAAQPWDSAPAPASDERGTWFRASGLDAAHLAPGPWELRLVLRRSGRTLDELPVARVLVERCPRPSPRGIAFFVATGLALGLTSVPGAAVLALVAAQVLVFAHGQQPAVPRDEVFPATATEAIVGAELGHGRFLADPGVLPPSTGLVRGLASVQGYDALDVRRYDALRPYVQRPGAHPLLGWNARGIDLDRPVAALLGVTVVVAQTPFKHPDWELVAGPAGAPRFAETWIHVRREREGAPARAFCVARVVPRDEALAALERFDPRTTAFVDGDGVRLERPFERAAVRFVRDEPETIELAVELDGDGLLVLCDTWYPGWTAALDGEPVDLLRVDDVVRGVALGPGRHRVRFDYRPLDVRVGAALSALALALAIAVGLAGAIRSRRWSSARTTPGAP